jgi:probable phosphoglycerate mutase
VATRVILVRHGTSTYNLLRKVQGHNDEASLADAGRQDAARVGEALKAIPLDAVYSSPLKRAKETAEIILGHRSNVDVVPQFTDNLKEINLLAWEGMPFEDVKTKFPEQYKAWNEHPHTLKMPLETSEGTVDFYPVPELFKQAERFWQGVLPKHEGHTILVVAHSGINRSLICTATGLGPEYYRSFEQANCGISVLNFAGGFGDPVQLESVNQTTHLGQKMPKFRGKSGLRVLLVRHGETEWNRQKKFQGQIDVPLNENGRAQSEKAAEFLADVPIDRAVSSPMARPKETAEIILKRHPGVPLDLDENLLEIGHGKWEGKLEEEIAQEYAQVLEDWKRSPQTVQMPDGENLQQVWQRAIAAWDAMLASTPLQENKVTTVMVAAHDAINKAILCYLVGWEPDQFWTFKQGNGSVTVIDYPNGPAGRVVINSLNITSHISGGVLDVTAAGAL